MHSAPKKAGYVAAVVYLVTAVVWTIGVTNHRFLWSEFWIYVGIFLLPGGLVCLSAWLIFMERLWARFVGIVLVLPALALWVVSLLLVYAGFRIH